MSVDMARSSERDIPDICAHSPMHASDSTSADTGEQLPFTVESTYQAAAGLHAELAALHRTLGHELTSHRFKRARHEPQPHMSAGQVIYLLSSAPPDSMPLSKAVEHLHTIAQSCPPASRVSMANHPVVLELVDTCCVQADQLREEQLVQVLWSIARLSGPSGAEPEPELVHRLEQLAGQCSPALMGEILWSLAWSDARLDPSTHKLLSAQVVRIGSEFGASTLPHVFWAVGLLGLCATTQEHATLGTIVGPVMPRLDSFQLEAVATLFVRWTGIKPSETFRNLLAEQINQLLPGFSTGQIAQWGRLLAMMLPTRAPATSNDSACDRTLRGVQEALVCALCDPESPAISPTELARATWALVPNDRLSSAADMILDLAARSAEMREEFVLEELALLLGAFSAVHAAGAELTEASRAAVSKTLAWLLDDCHSVLVYAPLVSGWSTIQSLAAGLLALRVHPDPGLTASLVQSTQSISPYRFDPAAACSILEALAQLNCSELPESYLESVVDQLLAWHGHSGLTPEQLAKLLWALATLAHPGSEVVWKLCGNPAVGAAPWSAVHLRQLFVAFLVEAIRIPEGERAGIETHLLTSGLLGKMRVVGLTAPLGALSTRRKVSLMLARFGIQHSLHVSVNFAPGALCIIDIKVGPQLERSKLMSSHKPQLVGLVHALYTSRNGQLAIQVDEAEHFCTNTAEELADLKNRNLLLSAQGWCVLTFGTHEWEQVTRLADGVEKYLESKFLRALMRLPKCPHCDPFKISCGHCVSVIERFGQT